MADDWDPPPGMVKCVCQSCRRAFANRRRVSVCPNCQVTGRAGRTGVESGTAFSQGGSGGFRLRPKGING